ncbi:MAG: hypothetical protein IPJ01_12235 [Micavibrio sp.]|nr:hypothetical protein [Micavibrio sp.]
MNVSKALGVSPALLQAFFLAVECIERGNPDDAAGVLDFVRHLGGLERQAAAYRIQKAQATAKPKPKPKKAGNRK